MDCGHRHGRRPDHIRRQWAVRQCGRSATVSPGRQRVDHHHAGLLRNGSYTLRGNAITMKQDDGKTTPGFFRIEQESKDDGRTWADAFYLMRTSSVDGQEYELRFKRNR